MSNEQLLETWNRTFGFKIHAGDLQAPTEEFVINALLQILDSINIDINVIKEEIFSTNQDLVEQGKICLFQYVNRFYKKLTINSNKKRSFLYGDLIQPTPKRTTHVLQTLLNYVLYYSMTEEEILSNTQSVIEKYQELVNKKAKLLAEQEQNKALAADQKLKLDSYTKDLEEITKRNESLKTLPVLSEFEDNKEKKVRLIQKKGYIMINIEDLKSKVINVEKIADMEGCGSPSAESPSLSQSRHRFLLTDCLKNIDNFLNKLKLINDENSIDLAIAASHLRAAVQNLSKISGQVTTDDILDVIFRDFCIGK